MSAPEEERHVQWCKGMFFTLAPGGVWGVPRSGLVFERTGERALALVARMPYEDGMPIDPVELEAYQQGDFEQIQHYMGLGGILVSDRTIEEEHEQGTG